MGVAAGSPPPGNGYVGAGGGYGGEEANYNSGDTGLVVELPDGKLFRLKNPNGRVVEIPNGSVVKMIDGQVVEMSNGQQLEMVDGCLVEIRPATIALGDEEIVSHKVHATHGTWSGKNVTIMRNVTIIRAADGSVGLRFLRPNKTTNGPFEVTELVSNGAAERNGGVQVGDTILGVNGRDISCLSAADVALLVRGQPATALELAILSSNGELGTHEQCKMRAALKQAGVSLP